MPSWFQFAVDKGRLGWTVKVLRGCARGTGEGEADGPASTPERGIWFVVDCRQDTRRDRHGRLYGRSVPPIARALYRVGRRHQGSHRHLTTGRTARGQVRARARGSIGAGPGQSRLLTVGDGDGVGGQTGGRRWRIGLCGHGVRRAATASAHDEQTRQNQNQPNKIQPHLPTVLIGMELLAKCFGQVTKT